MTTVWADVGARARGLSTRLLGGAALRDLARARDSRVLMESLERVAPEFVPGAERRVPGPAFIELAARQVAGARLRVLARWCGPRAELLAPVFDAEDHRSIRAALRGAAAGSAPEERRAGLVATPAIPDAALDELTRQPTPAAVAALLLAWEHPLAKAILDEARREQPDPYLLERALDAGYAGRAQHAARCGDAALKDFVRVAMLAQQAWTALLSVDPEQALAPLRAELPATPLGRLLARGTPGADAVDRAALETQLVTQRAHARRDPLGLGPVLYFLARLRSEMRDLNRIAWGVAFDAPRAMLAGGVISP